MISSDVQLKFNRRQRTGGLRGALAAAFVLIVIASGCSTSDEATTERMSEPDWVRSEWTLQDWNDGDFNIKEWEDLELQPLVGAPPLDVLSTGLASGDAELWSIELLGTVRRPDEYSEYGVDCVIVFGTVTPTMIEGVNPIAKRQPLVQLAPRRSRSGCDRLTDGEVEAAGYYELGSISATIGTTVPFYKAYRSVPMRTQAITVGGTSGIVTPLSFRRSYFVPDSVDEIPPAPPIQAAIFDREMQSITGGSVTRNVPALGPAGLWELNFFGAWSIPRIVDDGLTGSCIVVAGVATPLVPEFVGTGYYDQRPSIGRDSFDASLSIVVNGVASPGDLHTFSKRPYCTGENEVRSSVLDDLSELDRPIYYTFFVPEGGRVDAFFVTRPDDVMIFLAADIDS